MDQQSGYFSESRDDDDAQSNSAGDGDSEERSHLEALFRSDTGPKVGDYRSTGDDEDNIAPKKSKKTEDRHWQQRAESGRQSILEVLTTGLPSDSDVPALIQSFCTAGKITPILTCAALMVLEGKLNPGELFAVDHSKIIGSREKASTSLADFGDGYAARQTSLLEKITLAVMDYVYKNDGKPYKVASDKSSYFRAIKRSRHSETRGLTEEAMRIMIGMNDVFSNNHQPDNDWKKKRFARMASQTFHFGDVARENFEAFYPLEWNYFSKVLNDCESLVKKKGKNGVVLDTTDIVNRQPYDRFDITCHSMAAAVINRAACSVFGDIRGPGHERQLTDAIALLAAAIDQCWGDDYENEADAEYFVSNLVDLYLPCFSFGFWENLRFRQYDFFGLSRLTIGDKLEPALKKLAEKRGDASKAW